MNFRLSFTVCLSVACELHPTDPPWSPPYLLCVSGVYASTRSTRPGNHGARKKSHMQEPIIENTGNTRGEEQAFGCWFAGELYRSLVRLQHRLFVSGFLYRCYFKGVLAHMTVTRIDTCKATFKEHIVYFLLPQHQGLHIEELCSPKSPRLDWQRNWTVCRSQFHKKCILIDLYKLKWSKTAIVVNLHRSSLVLPVFSISQAVVWRHLKLQIYIFRKQWKNKHK